MSVSDAALQQRVRDLSLRVSGGMSSYDPPISIQRVEEFERRNGLELPADYRWFITHVASGGPGPYNGLLPFSTARLDPELTKAWIDPLRWNETDGDYEEDEGEEEGGLYQGALAVCDAGCGGLVLLVLVGPHRGEVWLDLTAGSSGFRKLGDSYCQWYGAWVDAERALLDGKQQAEQEKLEALQSAATSPSEETLRRVLYALGSSGDSEAFAYYLDKATELGALSEFSAATIIDDALSLSCAEAAERLLDRRLQDQGDGTIFSCLRALVRMHRGNSDGAMADWRRAQAAEDFDPPPRCAARIAMARLVAGELADAVSVYIGADNFVLGPASEVTAQAMTQGLHELALTWCDAYQERIDRLALDVDDDDVDDDDVDDDDVDDDEMREMLADVHAARVRPLLAAKRASEAERAVAVAEELGASIDWQHLALAACEARSFETCLVFLGRCSGPAWWTSNLRGCCLEGLDQLDDALASFEESIASRNWIVPFENRAYVYIRQELYLAAQELLDQVEAFAPEFAWTHYHRAVLHARQGATAEAELALQKALSLGLDPQMPKTEPSLAGLKAARP